MRDANKANIAFKNCRNIEIVVGDITAPETLKDITDDIDVTVHLAALLGDFGNKESDIWNVNVKGS